MTRAWFTSFLEQTIADLPLVADRELPAYAQRLAELVHAQSVGVVEHEDHIKTVEVSDV